MANETRLIDANALVAVIRKHGCMVAIEAPSWLFYPWLIIVGIKIVMCVGWDR